MAIPNATKQNHHMGDVMEDITMSIRAEDFPHLADVLNGLYSDPITAVVREYSTNAWDSHVSAGLARPIEVTLPTSDSLEFVVQDFGLGLSVDDLRNVYSMYGRSLKRDSNDVAGQLGLGCKSALSYAEAFTIIAVKGGVKVIAMSTKDERGIGVIKVLDTLGTDEPNGVTVKVPVGRYDVTDFHAAAEHLFQFWEPGTVLIDGEAPAVPEWRNTALRLDDDTWLVRQDSGLYSSYVIMGNVAYPVPDAIVSAHQSHRFVARLNIGDVDFVPSREDVKYTAWTKETLSDLTHYIATRYRHALATALANVTSRWEETLLRALWVGRTVAFRTNASSPIWHYNPNAYQKKAKSTFHYTVDQLSKSANTHVITGFPAKNISTVARDRLAEFIAKTDPDNKRPMFMIFPTGMGGAIMLDGRPNTHTWNDVLANTTDNTPAARAARAKQAETRYSLAGGGDATAADLAKVKGKVLYTGLGDGQVARYGLLNATVVYLRSSNQIARLTRLVPKATPYSEEVTKRYKAAKDALTANDSAIVLARTLPSHLKALDPAHVDDPELAADIRMAKVPDTSTMVAAAAFGIQPENKDSLESKYNKRYPLLAAASYYSYRLSDKANLPEVLIYVNAKFDALTAPAQAVAS